MRNFKEIVASAGGKRLLVAPQPGKMLWAVLREAEKLGYQVEIENSAEQAAESVRAAFQKMAEKKADILIQGNIPLNNFFKPLVAASSLEKFCFVSVFEDYIRKKLLFIADTYIHSFPSFSQKVNILNNAVEIAKVLGVERPMVATLSALETVNPAIPSSIEAAALSKMSDRGQFDAIVEGPLDIDTALSKVAAERKGVNSAVPGEVDILLCPDIESAFALSQFITFLGKMPVAGVLLGGTFPVVIHPAFIPRENKMVEIAISAIRNG